MGAAENKQFIRNMFVELSKGNAEVFLGGMAEDVHFTIIGTTKYSGTVSSSIEERQPLQQYLLLHIPDRRRQSAGRDRIISTPN
jgi:ketosteroid isomerase-like protein